MQPGWLGLAWCRKKKRGRTRGCLFWLGWSLSSFLFFFLVLRAQTRKKKTLVGAILCLRLKSMKVKRRGKVRRAMALVVLVVNEGEDVGCCCRGCTAWWWSKVMVMAGSEVLVALCFLRSGARYASFFFFFFFCDLECSSF